MAVIISTVVLVCDHCKIGIGLDQLAVIADQMVGDRGRAAVAAGINRAARAIDLRQEAGGLFDPVPIDRRGGGRHLREVSAGVTPGVGEFVIGEGHGGALEVKRGRSHATGAQRRKPLPHAASSCAERRRPATIDRDRHRLNGPARPARRVAAAR